MSIKAILVLALGNDRTEATLQTAILAARRFQAHLEALHVRPGSEMMVPYSEGVTGPMIRDMIEAFVKEADRRAAEAREVFDRLCGKSGFSVGWREALGSEPETLTRLGRLADIIVMGRPIPADDPLTTVSLHAALFETGRPVLVAPTLAPKTLGERIVVAWDGGAQAARAVDAALPFLGRASRITVVGPDKPAKGSGPKDLLAYLARHGIDATAESLEATAANAGDELLKRAARHDADLLVMGAFGHSRVREWILGGATRTVLANAGVPVLLAH